MPHSTPGEYSSSTEPVTHIVLPNRDADRFVAEATADPDYSTDIQPYYDDTDGFGDGDLVRVIVSARRDVAEFVGIAHTDIDRPTGEAVLRIVDTNGRIVMEAL